MKSKDLEVFEKMPFNFFVKDEQGRYVWVNQAVLKLAKVASEQEIIGKTDRDLIWADNADALSKVDREVLETGKTAGFDTQRFRLTSCRSWLSPFQVLNQRDLLRR